jgi:signal peptidase II
VAVQVLLFVTSISAAVSLAVAMATDWWLQERIAIIGEFAGLQRSYNPGIAFGMHLGPFQDFIILTALALLIWAGSRTARSSLEQTGFGLVIGGGTANTIDRLLDGAVTDMVQVGSFPIFNAADICINAGAALLLFGFLSEWWKGRQMAEKRS